MSAVLGTAFVRIQPSMLGFGAALAAGLGGEVTKAMTTIGSSATLLITAPIVAGIGAALNQAVKFESAFAGVRKTVNGTDGEFAQLEKSIIDMANRMPFAREEIAKVMEQAGRFGVPTDQLAGFTEIALKLGSATGMGAAGAAEALTKLGNIMNLPSDQFKNLSSAVVALGNDFPTTEANILNFSNRLAGAGALVGLTGADVVGFAAGLSSLGVKAEAGGTAFSRVFLKMNDAAMEGGEKLDGFLKVMGMTKTEFETAWRDDPAMAVMDFVSGIHDITESGGNTTKVLSDLELGEIRVRDALLRSSNGYDTMAAAMFTARQGYTDNTALDIEYAKRADTTASKLKILGNNFSNVALQLGQALIPMLTKLIPTFQSVAEMVLGWVEAFTNLNPHTQEFILKALAVAAVLGPIVLVGAKVINMIIGLKTAFVVLGTAMKAHPYMLLVAAIIAAAIIIYKNWDSIVEFLKKAWASFRSAVEPIRAWFMDNVWPMMVTVWEAMQDVWDVVLPALQAVWRGIQAGWDGIIAAGGFLITAFKAVWQWLKDLWVAADPVRILFAEGLKIAIDVLKTAWDALWTGISTVVSWMQTLWDKSDGVRGFLVDAFKVAIDVIVGAWNLLWAGISTVVDWLQTLWDKSEGVRGFLADAFRIAIEVVKTAFDVLWATIQTVWDWMQKLWNNTENVRSLFADMLKLAIDVVKLAFDVLWGSIQIGWQWMKDLWNATDPVRDLLGNALKLAVDVVKGALDLLWQTLETVWGWMGDVWDATDPLRDLLGNAFKLAVDVAKGAIDLFWGALETAFGWVQDLWDKSEGLRNFLTGIFTTGIQGLGSIWNGVINSISTVVSWLQKIVDTAESAWSWIQKLAGQNPVTAGPVTDATQKAIDQANKTTHGTPTVPGLGQLGFQKKHSGGVVTGAYGSEVPTLLRARERVLTEDQDALMRQRGTAGGGNQVVFTGDFNNVVDMDAAYRLALFHLSAMGT